MKTNSLKFWMAGSLAMTFLALTGNFARAEIEDTITNSFGVQPGGHLVVEIDRGSIQVNTTDKDSVNIEVRRATDAGAARAAEIFKNHVVTMTRDGDTVTVRAEYKGKLRSGWFGRREQLHVACRITVPRKFDVNLNTSGGSIKVSDLTGKVEVRTSGGSLSFNSIEGPVSAHTSGGSISASHCRGNAELATSGGSLRLSDIVGDVDARTSGGSVRADQLTGKSILKTSGGSIRLAGIKGQVDARTSGGSIRADLPEQPSGDCSFKTSGGSITVALGPKVAVDVDARTSSGRVSSEFPVAAVIQGEQKKGELRGKINGGGPLITASTSAGHVRFEKD